MRILFVLLQLAAVLMPRHPPGPTEMSSGELVRS
jgi:hypothetical protein